MADSAKRPGFGDGSGEFFDIKIKRDAGSLRDGGRASRAAGTRGGVGPVNTIAERLGYGERENDFFGDRAFSGIVKHARADWDGVGSFPGGRRVESHIRRAIQLSTGSARAGGCSECYCNS